MVTFAPELFAVVTLDASLDSLEPDVVLSRIPRRRRIDVLVNNAGFMALAPLAKRKAEEWDRIVDINVEGVLYNIAAALPVFERQKSGHIINIGSGLDAGGRRARPEIAAAASTRTHASDVQHRFSRHVGQPPDRHARINRATREQRRGSGASMITGIEVSSRGEQDRERHPVVR